MLPSSQRLTRQQVTAILSDPEIKVIFNRIGTLKYVSSPDSKALSVVTGSKQQKKAVLRNKVRRQLYESFSSYEKPSNIKGILYISKHLYDMSFQEIKDTFYALLSKIEKNS